MTRETESQKKEEATEMEIPAFSKLASTPNPILLKTSEQASDRISFYGLSPLNENELKSVYALLAYVAHNQRVRQETVQAVVETRFGVDQVEKLAQKDYEEVIRFLVDLCVEELLH
jgi:hypothetical protein